MKFDSFSMYSELTKNEVKTNTDVADVNKLIRDLEEFNNETEVREWLLSNWGIKDSISNFPISQSTKLTTSKSNKYLNVTIMQEKEIQSYNFKNGDLQ